MSRKSKRFIPAAGEPNSSINITPLVDVVLVLLIIFMVVTPLLEKDISVRVPKTEQVEEKTEVPPDQLVVRIEQNGDLTINNEKVPRPSSSTGSRRSSRRSRPTTSWCSSPPTTAPTTARWSASSTAPSRPAPRPSAWRPRCRARPRRAACAACAAARRHAVASSVEPPREAPLTPPDPGAFRPSPPPSPSSSGR